MPTVVLTNQKVLPYLATPCTSHKQTKDLWDSADIDFNAIDWFCKEAINWEQRLHSIDKSIAEVLLNDIIKLTPVPEPWLQQTLLQAQGNQIEEIQSYDGEEQLFKFLNQLDEQQIQRLNLTIQKTLNIHESAPWLYGWMKIVWPSYMIGVILI